MDSFLCTNDSAERGIKLITDYKDSCFGIEEREYLAQVVEKHRMSFKATSGQASGQTYNKKTMESVFGSLGIVGILGTLNILRIPKIPKKIH